MTYHKFPSVRRGLVRLYRWLTEPTHPHDDDGCLGCRFERERKMS